MRCDNRVVTAEDFRALALTHAAAVEGAHMGHPDFRLNGRIFATLTSDGARGMVKLTPEQQREFLKQDAAFEPASGAWGRQGSTMVSLARAKTTTVRAAMTLAWENAEQLPPPKSRRTPRKQR
jgi:hypothetical protein